MKIQTKLFCIYILILCFGFISCEDFVEVDVPDSKLTSQTVYSNDQTAESVLTGIFNQLFNSSFANGGSQSVTFTAGLSADNFRLTTVNTEIQEFHQNQIIPTNNYNLTLWSGAYNMIYMINAMLNGIEDNSSLSQDLKDRMEGSGKFLRAFTYFYLVNTYGEVPLILDTDYKENALATRTSTNDIYNQILDDLEQAKILLAVNYFNDDRTHPNRFTALALLSRVHLYLGNWEEANFYSSQVIEATSTYELLNDLNQVFLANSKEAIWQISPIGWGNSFTHTREGSLMIINATSNTPVALSENFLNSFEDSLDMRRQEWVEAFNSEQDSMYFPFKYKIQYDASGGEINEYSMVLRLAEQYLIRAEAKTNLGEMQGAIQDLNVIKARAGISIIEESSTITESELYDIILLERRRELFAEWGHRWYDLRRFGKADILADKDNSNWTPTSNLFPIPSSERMKNPNLSQNPGY